MKNSLHTSFIRYPVFYFLLIFLIIINVSGIIVHVLEGDAVLYANIAKNSYITRDWINLTWHGSDWLDKPHLPFWVINLSFGIFGVNSSAYLLSGLIFGLMGAIYTYKLTKYFSNGQVAIVALVMYLSTRSILLFTSVDVRAEAFLLGEILPACYYWAKYYNDFRYSFLFKGAIFSACAIMTKGIFVLIPLFSGILGLMWYQNKLYKFFTLKWGLAFFLTLLFITPEIVCLIIQFDLHPEKVIFGKTNVSGLLWFFWGSQFGRFFNFGPIHQEHINYFDFIEVLPDLLLPWFFIALIVIIFMLFFYKKNVNFNVNICNGIYFAGTIFVSSFILFSISHFHQIHYIVILLPFLLIIVAIVVVNANIGQLRYITNIQYLIAIIQFIVALLGIVAYIYLTKSIWPLIIILLTSIMLVVSMFLTRWERLIVVSAISGSLLFFAMMLEHKVSLTNFNSSTYFAQFLPENQSATILMDNSVPSMPFIEFIAKNVIKLNGSYGNLTKPYYIITKYKTWQHMKKIMGINGYQVANYPYAKDFTSYIDMIHVLKNHTNFKKTEDILVLIHVTSTN